MKKLKSVLCAGMAMAVIGSAAAFAGCQPEDKKSENNGNSEIYAIYTKYAEAAGEDAMTYEEWLESIKGEDGKDGATWLVSNGAPANTTGKDGDLCLDSSTFDLYQRKAGAWSKIGSIKGADGEDGDDGEGAYEAWKALDPENNTATKAEWLESLKGQNGATGTKWFYGEGAPADSDKVADAQVGDFYLDTSSGNVYCKGADNWGEPVFNFGAAGVAPQNGKVTVDKMMPALATVDNVNAGWNYVYLDTGDSSITATDIWVSNYYTGSLDDSKTSYTMKSYFMKSKETRHDGKNIYVAFINVPTISDVAINTFKFETKSATPITDATITFEKAESQEFQSGVPFYAPVFYYNMPDMTKDETGFTHFTSAPEGVKSFNGYKIKVQTSFSLSVTASEKNKKLRLTTMGNTGKFDTLITKNNKDITLSETGADTSSLGNGYEANIINHPIYLMSEEAWNTNTINYSFIMPAWVTITEPAA